MAAASASGRNDARKKLTANSRTEQKDNEINDFSEWNAVYQFGKLVWFGGITTLINLVITVCLFALAEIQNFIWIIKLGKDSILVIQLQKTALVCLSLTMFIVFVQTFCVFGVRFIKKQLKIIRWWPCIGSLFISFSLGILLCILSRTEIVQKGLELIFDQKIPPCVNENSTSKDKDSFLPKRNLVSYLECSAIICNIHQIIVLIVLIRWKPKNFDWLKYLDEIQQESTPPKSANNLKV